MILGYTSISAIRVPLLLLLSQLNACLQDVQQWMALSELKHNHEKTESIVFGSKAQC